MLSIDFLGCSGSNYLSTNWIFQACMLIPPPLCWHKGSLSFSSYQFVDEWAEVWITLSVRPFPAPLDQLDTNYSHGKTHKGNIVFAVSLNVYITAGHFWACGLYICILVPSVAQYMQIRMIYDLLQWIMFRTRFIQKFLPVKYYFYPKSG